MRVNQKLMGFAAGTKVLMADGKEKAIENIKTGDLVLSFDQLDAFGKLESKRVLNTFKRLDRNPLKVKVVGSNVELTVAPGQLFINPGSDWKDAININEIIDSEGNIHKFNVNQITRGKYQMYDIIVEDNHSLIANGVRVHNMLYTVGDVIAGRNLAETEIQSGPLRYDGNDYSYNNEYSEGRNRKKKRSKNRRNISPPIPKVDGVQAAQKYIREIDDLVDTLETLISNTSTTNLTVLKITVQYSIDTITNFGQNLIASLVSGTMSAYDKSESLIIVADIISTSSAMRKPFEETVVSANGKNLALAQLTLIELLIDRLTKKLATYTTPPKEETRSTTKKKTRSSRGINGSYNQPTQREQLGGTGRSGDFGSDKGRPTGGSSRGGGTSTKSTGGGSGSGGSPGGQTRSTGGLSAKSTSPGGSVGGAPGGRGGSIGTGNTNVGIGASAPRAGEKSTRI